MEHCEGMRECFHTHMYICTHTHTHWAIVVVQSSSQKRNNGCPPLWSGHVGLRAIVCVLSTSKIRRKVGPNFWLEGLCDEWTRSTGDTMVLTQGEQYNSMRNTNGISWLSLSWAQLFYSPHRRWYWQSTVSGSVDQCLLVPHIWITTNRKHLEVL